MDAATWRSSFETGDESDIRSHSSCRPYQRCSCCGLCGEEMPAMAKPRSSLVEQRQRQVRREVDERPIDRLRDALVLVHRRTPHQRQQARVHLALRRKKAEDLDTAPHQLVVQRLSEDELNNLLALDPLHEEVGGRLRHLQQERGGRAAVRPLLTLGAVALHLLHRLQAFERQREPQSVESERTVGEPRVIKEHVKTLLQLPHRLAVLEFEHLVRERRDIPRERTLHLARMSLQHSLFEHFLHLEQRPDQHLHRGEIEKRRLRDARDERLEAAHGVEVLHVSDVVVGHILAGREVLASPLLLWPLIGRGRAVEA
eukprot:scaffold123396_cov30-Tisochrysis_lutea.AAC.2